MPLRALIIAGFRNLQPQHLLLPDSPIILLGPNGAGKTSLLEALAVLGNLTSFRPSSPLSWVQYGAFGFRLSGDVARAGGEFRLTVEARRGSRLLRHLFRGTRRLAPPEYLTLFPVFTLSTADRLLIWGGPEERRRFLDRLAFYLRPETYLVAQAYRRTLRHRNAALRANASDAELEAFERHLALLGSRLLHLRLSTIGPLEEALSAELETLAWSLPRPLLRYNDKDGATPGSPAEVAGRLRLVLARSRQRERARAQTLVGPHRHDVDLAIRGSPARDVLSAGQGKLLATALKLAAMAVVERMRSRKPLVVFDDVDAELDPRSLGYVMRRLAGHGQVLVSSSHEPIILPTLPDAVVWHIDAGLVAGAQPAPGVDP